MCVGDILGVLLQDMIVYTLHIGLLFPTPITIRGDVVIIFSSTFLLLTVSDMPVSVMSMEYIMFGSGPESFLVQLASGLILEHLSHLSTYWNFTPNFKELLTKQELFLAGVPVWFSQLGI